MYANYLKRFFDFLIALIALLVLSPILIVTAILVRIKLGSPVIFKQERPGYQEKIFTLYKFRTMTNGTDAKGNLLPDEQRLTHFGKFLRKTSIDELPEMFNIQQQESFVEEDFSKNVVRCSFASSNGICTVGFVSTPIARPMTLLRGDELDHSKAKHLKLLLSKERDEERFSQILIGKKKDIKYLASEIEELINTNLFDA